MARETRRPLFPYGQARTLGLVVVLLTTSLLSAAQPPWPGKYKIAANDQGALTAADVVGPDGIVYPSWMKCGIQGGIPDIPARTHIEDHGGKPNDDADDSAALRAACDFVGRQGGGAVVLAAGTYDLDHPVTVRHDGVVIRGQGPAATRLVFRYSVGEQGVMFYSPAAHDQVGSNTLIEMHALPTELMKMTILIDNQQLGQWERSQHSGNTFAYRITGARIPKSVPDGSHTLVAAAEYANGQRRWVRMPVVLKRTFRDSSLPDYSQAAITFQGGESPGKRVLLAEDGNRGSNTLVLEPSHGLRPGDCLVIEAPATPRWNALTRNACKWGSYRRYVVRVDSVHEQTVILEQPLRIDFPAQDGAFVQRIEPVRRCGIENLAIEQTENLWITTVLFRNAWECWARGVHVTKCGRHPVYADQGKFCEIRDCVFEDAWFKGGGGTAYAGWERSYDCLMENVETFNLRHAPLFQWSASGCVIRKSVFHNSDGQWHSGWTNENLIEQCVIESARGNGGYGYGLWASPPEDTAHGPNGPRNVVYNCDVQSPRTGLWMGGMNEAWLIVHNRFRVQQGPGIFAKTASFDHIICGNVMSLHDPQQPAIVLATEDCTGVDLRDNRIYGGNGQLAGGSGRPVRSENNTMQPATDAPPVPQPAVISIFDWQRKSP